MTDAPAAPSAEQAAPEAPADAPTQTVDDLPDWARESIAKANKEAATYRAKLREAEPLAREAREIKEAQKSAEQRAADQTAAAQRDRDEAKTESLRYRAAMKHKLPEDALDLLGSGDEDTIEARAKQLGGYAAAATERDSLKAEVDRLTAENEALRTGRPVPLTGRPVTDLRPGATPTPAPDVSDNAYPAEWLPAKRSARSGQ